MIEQILKARARRWAFLTVAATLFVGACSREQLLEVQLPDQITPELAGSPVGANALRVSAIGNFAFFYGGDYGGSFHGLSITSGLLSDEMEQARGATEHVDSRAQNEALTPLTTTWGSVGQANTQLIRAIRALKQYALETNATEKATKGTQIGQLYVLRGYVLLLVGETYCNGVPIADANDASPSTEILSNAQLWDRALAQFDTAMLTLGTATADAPLKNLVAVGRGRVLLDQGKFTEAAAAVTAVPTNFVYNVFYSNTVVNAVYDWMNGTLNYAPADLEGGNGLPFISARDPRVTVQRNDDGTPTPRNGQDGRTHFTQTVFSQPTSPIWLASGVEARLIEAEAALRAGNTATYVLKVNEARATRTDLPALVLPATATAQLNQLMSERAFWFWGTSHRLGDLRRLVRQYGRATESVFPTGPYFAGGAYGTDVALVPGQAEKNNLSFTGCANNNP
jgi:starch-binding outer membrane protein, SusD/RagB family